MTAPAVIYAGHERIILLSLRQATLWIKKPVCDDFSHHAPGLLYLLGEAYESRTAWIAIPAKSNDSACGYPRAGVVLCVDK
jgi:hypothetical protein